MRIIAVPALAQAMDHHESRRLPRQDNRLVG